MYAFDISIKNYNSDYKNLAADLSSYVYLLARTGQVLQREQRVVVNEKNTCRVPVLCPEIDSFALKNGTSYALDMYKKISEQSHSKIEYIPIGREADSLNYKVPENSSYYILRNGWSSPLLCGDTHQAIPLYKIPYTAHNGMDFDNITFWNNDYERLFGLWISGLYEDFAIEEMQNVHSEINEAGQNICSKVEALTGTPTFLFLFNYRNWSKEEDLQRKCPLTGKKWLIKDSTADDFISFKCNESRLVSELSHNCDAE
jgi:predicted  nucleic acid-binding Zn ribbon protein